MRGSTAQGSSTGSVRGRIAAAKLGFTVLFFFITKWLCGMEHFLSLCSGSLWFLQHVIAEKGVIFNKLLLLCVIYHKAIFLLKYKFRKLRSCSPKMMILSIFIFILHTNYMSSFSKIKPQCFQLRQFVCPFCFTSFAHYLSSVMG